MKNRVTLLIGISGVIILTSCSSPTERVMAHEPRKMSKEATVQAVNPQGFFPVLTTDKLVECRNFYIKHFGFKVAFEADWYIHLISEKGIQLGFLQPGRSSQPAFLHNAYPGHGVVYSFEVDNVDQEYEKIKSSKVQILLHVRTEEWGQKHFMVKDPGGMIIDLVQAVEPTREYKNKYAE